MHKLQSEWRFFLLWMAKIIQEGISYIQRTGISYCHVHRKAYRRAFTASRRFYFTLRVEEEFCLSHKVVNLCLRWACFYCSFLLSLGYFWSRWCPACSSGDPVLYGQRQCISCGSNCYSNIMDLWHTLRISCFSKRMWLGVSLI